MRNNKFFCERFVLLLEAEIIGLCVVEEDVDIAWPLVAGSLPTFPCGVAYPDNFVSEVPCSEEDIHHHLEVVAGGRVAVEVEDAVPAVGALSSRDRQ